jgi:hypothetical protein
MRTEHFTLNLARKYVGGTYHVQIGIHHRDSRDITIPVGVKHVDSDGCGIFSTVISDAASFPGLPLEARSVRVTEYRKVIYLPAWVFWSYEFDMSNRFQRISKRKKDASSQDLPERR